MEEIAMTITKTAENGTLRIALEGRLDTNTAPQLEAELKTSLSGITELELDFSGLEYISSAGLRVLLAAQKTMSRQGKMTIRNVNETIMEVFEITGFVEILTIV
ncbi:STAS domain-containing protein [Oscillibacter valericigenes]|jgi:anti-anti-sigma factor|uniref:STAS domain-containing protein n=1 Tax=Oscillibacter valericigenes TaxID=351091 RepID=UPI0030B8E4DB